MTRRDTLQAVHEPFGDAYYFGPERIAERYEDDEKARLESGYADSTYKTIFDRIARDNSEVGSLPCAHSCLSIHYFLSRLLLDVVYVQSRFPYTSALLFVPRYPHVHSPHDLTTIGGLLASYTSDSTRQRNEIQTLAVPISKPLLHM
jgi:hypothetical protein